ncbi:MAG: DUF2911 domain-containing protein [Gemmatimonadales bacterium]|nr:DUF2911 domain-containing protein [Gemmatimonadales bacterium]
MGIAWLGVTILTVTALIGLLYRRLGVGGLTFGVGALAVGFAVLGGDWSGPLGTRLPCRHNWRVADAYLLRASPLRSVTFELGSTRVKVCYGAPASRGKRRLGSPDVPYGHLWRTGANEPTTIRSSGPIAIAGMPVVEGNVSLYTVPGPETWEIVVNRATKQWGREQDYTESIARQEVGRTIVPAGTLDPPSDRLTFAFEGMNDDSNSGTLILRWESTEVRLPIRADTTP